VSLALLPSPLLGPAVWLPVSQVLARFGWNTVICATPSSPRGPQDVFDAFLQALPMHGDLVLIPHSNAGAYVPTLTTQRSVVGVVFVDAILPPERGRIPLAPPESLPFLRGKADTDGVLPVWTDWWEEAEVAALFADVGTRREIEREQPRLPLTYFEDSLPAPEGWDDLPAGYLAFGNTYSHEREEARHRLWPVITADGGHLQLVNDPHKVAADIVDLLNRIGIIAPK
jgi:hypothetical protein